MRFYCTVKRQKSKTLDSKTGGFEKPKSLVLRIVIFSRIENK